MGNIWSYDARLEFLIDRYPDPDHIVSLQLVGQKWGISRERARQMETRILRVAYHGFRRKEESPQAYGFFLSLPEYIRADIEAGVFLKDRRHVGGKRVYLHPDW